MLERAAQDPRISGSAITGSAAVRREDRWSDIDLAFGVDCQSSVAEVLADWSSYMYGQHSVLHHVDVRAGAWIYRVFLLPGTLQVDIAFALSGDFRALGPAFQLIHGEANGSDHVPPTAAPDLIGMSWLYALHARTSIARGHLWQAEYMVSGVRDYALALACIRHSLPAVHGRGIDRLPAKVLGPLQDALVRELNVTELTRAFRAAVNGLQAELRSTDQQLADRLQETLTCLPDGIDPTGLPPA
ncbi:MAG: hypothetical protein WA324_27405 [Bryobacteraceae bacterium]